ncbi:MAG: hypothetical protein WC770_07395 [Phycisphaerae bacterium]|jgi:hypothetical protein
MKLQFPWQKTQLIRACIDFANMKLWERYDNLDFFVIQTPLEHPVVASIMGIGGQEYGLSLFRGPDAFRYPLTLDAGISAIDKMDTIGFSMIYYRDMDYIEKKWLKSCNYRANNSDWLPSVICKKPMQMTEFVEKDKDVKLMLYALKGIIWAQKNGKFSPKTLDVAGSKMLTIEVSGDASEPDVKVTRKSFPGSKELLEMCNDNTAFEDSQLMPDISALPKLDETWVVVPVYLPGMDDKNERCILTIAEEESNYILHADVITMTVNEAVETLHSVFSGDNAAESVGVPSKIVIAEKELYVAITSCLQALDIDVCYNKNHPVAKDIRESLQQDIFAFAKKHIVKPLELPDIDFSIVPADDDLQGWKAVGKTLTNLFINFWHDSDFLRKNRPGKQFFGNENWDYYLEEYDDVMVLPTYVTWAALTYRAKKGEPTFVETQLAGAMPRSLRSSLEALNKAYPSLYQILDTNAETGFITLKNLLIPETITVHDYGLSKTAKSDWMAPFWVHSVGNFSFVDIAGPLFGPLNATEIIEELQELNLPTNPSPQWLRENAYIFGRLWELYDELTELSNTDDKPEKSPENKNIFEETLPDELVAGAQEYINKYYMDWLDQSIPALDNKTPRQAIKNIKNVQKVRIMIETIPAPAGKAKIIIPKNKMLKELGLSE